MKITLRSGALSAAVGAGLSLAVLPAVPASAAAGGTHVRCNDIPGLVKAVNKANSGAGSGRITLASRCTYTLTAPDNDDDGLPQITGNVTVTGRDTTIRRASSATEDFRIFNVASGGKLTLNSLTLRGGRLLGGLGGGAFNDGTLNLNKSTVEGNRADAGGGIVSSGTLKLRNSTVERNTADSFGGGIYNEPGGRLTMTGGALLKNRAVTDNGGGLENIGGTASLKHVSVRGNTAIRGGGIRQTTNATLRLESSTVRDNIAVAGAGISNLDSSATLIRSLVTRNTAITMGGGIDNQSPSEVTLTDSRVVRNTPDDCTPAGSVPGCSNPAGAATPSNPPALPPGQGTGGDKPVS